MKYFVAIILIVFSFSCSSDDNCQDKKDEINAKFDKQIQEIKDNPGPNGIDYRQISLMNEERQKKLDKACN